MEEVMNKKNLYISSLGLLIIAVFLITNKPSWTPIYLIEHQHGQHVRRYHSNKQENFFIKDRGDFFEVKRDYVDSHMQDSTFLINKRYVIHYSPKE